jgi:hypothetical protein
MDAAYDATAAVAAGSLYWHYGRDEGYGLLHADGREKEELLDAVVRPYPERVAGDPVAWSFEDERLVLVYRRDPDIAAPTVIAAPRRRWPGGAAVTEVVGPDGLVTLTAIAK